MDSPEHAHELNHSIGGDKENNLLEAGEMETGFKRSKWDKHNTRGRHLLINFNLAYLAIGQVCRRFRHLKLNRKVVTSLIEIYLTEEGFGYNPEILNSRDKFNSYVINPNAKRLELNDQGWEIVKAVIFAIRNRSDTIRERMKQAGQKPIE